MVIGAIGSHGNLAQCHVVQVIKKDLGDVTHQDSNLEVKSVEDLMLTREHAKPFEANSRKTFPQNSAGLKHRPVMDTVWTHSDPEA